MFMAARSRSTVAGFTLVEIMIVIAIIATLAAIAVPNFLRARKRAHATVIIEDLRLIDAAVDHYALETNRSPGYEVQWDDIKRYLKLGTRLYASAHTDVLGNDFGSAFSVDLVPAVPTDSFQTLSDVVPPEFWSPFRTP
jgi:prepilin-type N-terminal cleavage/methylation domain-containing protein